jgi:hypothetical protein
MIITVGGVAYACGGASMGRGEYGMLDGSTLWDDLTLHDVTHIDGQPTGVRGGEVVVHLKSGSYEIRGNEGGDG